MSNYEEYKNFLSKYDFEILILYLFNKTKKKISNINKDIISITRRF